MTPTQIQAVEMAIEALNSCRIMSVASTPAKEVTPKKITKAIEALRAALAEQADDKAVRKDLGCPNCVNADSWGIADKPVCHVCEPTAHGLGTRFIPINRWSAARSKP